MADIIQWKRGTAAYATAINPILAAGEAGYETDTGLFKIGDGVTPWNSLPYAGRDGGVAFSAGTQSASNNTVVFSNSNGISFGMSNSTVTASYTVPTQTQFVLSNSNGITFGTNVSTVTASFSAPPSATSLVFSNSNNVTFGVNASTLTASASFNQSIQTQNSVLINGSSGSLVFSNSNGISFGGNASTITASYTVPTVTNSSWTLSADTRSETVGQLVLSNSNGISFGLTGGTVTATVRTDYLTSQSNQTVGLYALGNTTQNTSTTRDARSISYNAIGGLSVGYSNGSVQLSAPATSSLSATGAVSISVNGSTISIGAPIQTEYFFSNSNGVTFGTNGSTITASVGGAAAGSLSAGTTNVVLGQVVFSNSNGISFGLNGSTVTGTVATNYQSQGAYLTTAMQSNAATISNINVSAGTTSNNLSALTFSDSNGISFGLSGSVVTGTVKTDYQSSNAGYLTSQSFQAFSAQGGSSAFQTIIFTNSNGFSFSNTAGSIWGSYTVPTVTNSSWSISDAVTSGTVGRLAFTNLNGVTLSLSTGAGGSHTIVGSHNALTTARASNDAIGLNTAQTNVTWTVNSSGLSLNAGGYAGTTSGTQGAGVGISMTHNSVGLNLSITAPTQTNQTIGVYGSSQTAGSASSGTHDARSLSFIGAGAISIGNHSTSAGGTTTGIIISAPVQSVQTQGMVSVNGSTGNVSFVVGSSLSSSVNGSTVTWGLASNITTALQSAGAYLTTADLSANSSNYFRNWKLTGNTAGTTSSAQGTDLWLAGGNGVTISGSSNTLSFSVATNYQSQGAYLTTAALSNHSHGDPTLALTNLTGTTASASNGFTLSLSAAAPSAGVGIAAGTRTATTAGNLLFDTGNGITFGLNAVGGSIMTASHNAITTGRASTDAIGLNTALTANGVAWTVNSSGLSLNVPAFLTTAAQSSASNVSGIIAGTNATGGTATLSGNVSFSNANGISFYTSAGNAVVGTVATNYQSQGAYLTTARASTDAIGLNSALTANGVSVTANSSGLSLNFPAFLTTAALSNHSHGVSFTSGSTVFQTLSFTNSNGISFNSGTQGIFGSHNAITTGRASTDAIGLNTAQTNVTWTANSSGISLNAAGYAGTTTGFAGANISGSITNNSLGLNLSLSVAPPGAAAENNWVNLLGANTAGNTTASGSTIGWSGINLTLSGTNASVVNISAPATSSLSGTGQVSILVNASTISIGVPNAIRLGVSNLGATAGTTGTIDGAAGQLVFVGSNGMLLSQSTNGVSATITFDDGQRTMSAYENIDGGLINSSAMTWNGTSMSHGAAFNMPQALSFAYMRMPALFTTNSTAIASMASATATAQGGIFSTLNAVIYSIGTGANSRSLQSVVSGSIGYTFSQRISVSNSTQASYSLGYTGWAETALTSLSTQYSVSNTVYSFTTNQFTAFTSARMLDLPFIGSLPYGNYWMVVGLSTSSSSAGAAGLAALTNCNVRYSAHYGVSNAALSFGIMGSSNLTSGGLMGAVSFSTGGQTTNSIPTSALSSMASLARIYFQLLRSA